MISEIKNLQNQNIDIQEYVKKAKENQKKCNSFVTILDTPILNQKKGSLLSGIPYVLKDNFSTKDILTTASSNTLKDYVPVYNATVYQKLIDAGAILIGKTAMDEFGLGGTGLTCHTGPVLNPIDKTRQAGGSSAGSAAAVLDGVVPFAIGSDTGDSVRKPAAYCGIVGYKPTYGMISRHGLFAFASSLDHVGVLTRSVMDAAIVVDAIKGLDEKDMTSWDSSDINLLKSIEEKDLKSKKLFYLKEIVDLNNYSNPSEDLKNTLNTFQKTMEIAKEIGYEVIEESIDSELLKTISAVYTCISCAEATSNLSNLTGITFGTRYDEPNINDLIKKHRTEGFSPLIKRRLVIGSYVLQKENQEKYFFNASRVRHLIVTEMKKLFQKYEAMILPCSEGGAKPIDTTECIQNDENVILENHMVIGNFGGFPSITIPNGTVNHLPIGINLTSDIKKDETLLKIAYELEQKITFQEVTK